MLNETEEKERRLEKQAAADYEYSTLMRLLSVSVSKHLLDEHFTLIWANDFFYDLIGYPQEEFNTRFHNRPDEYFYNNPEGFQLLVESVMGALVKGENGNSVYLPLIHPDRGAYWVKLQAAFTDEYIDGLRVAYTTLTDVTEMMQARQEFEKLTHEQDMLMSALNVSVSKHLIDEHYTCVRANEYYYRLIGYSKEKYEKLFHNHPDEYYRNNPEGWELLTQKVNEVLTQGGDQYELIVPMKYEDGSTYWVKLFSYFTEEYIDGCRTSYTVMTDVTELVKTKNEQEMLMQAMKVSVSRHLVDKHFTVVEANDFYYELIGYTREEYEAAFHNHCDEYFKTNEGSWEKIHSRIEEMYAAGKTSYELFVPLKLPDGSTNWVKMTGFFTDEYQDGMQLAYTTMVDVTELMQIQQEKAVAYDNIPGFIVKHRILKDKIVMIGASDGITDVFNVDLDHLESFDVYAALEPESGAIIKANHPRFRKGEPFEGTLRMKDRNDRVRWFQIRSTCTDSIADDPVYLTVFIDATDVTELREMQKQLTEQKAALQDALTAAEHANRAKSDFLSRMSHDIRTPMNAVLGMTKIGKKYVNNPERVMDCFQKIDVSSKLLIDLINEVLDMSKVESGQILLAEEEVNLAELVQGVVTMVQPLFQDKSLRFNTYVSGVIHETVVSDVQRLQQLVMNLLSNAVKYTSEGGSVSLEIRENPIGGTDTAHYEFIVSDTGIGMKPEFLSHVFDPFERAEDVKIQAVQGTGLGLSICKKIAEQMGGTIEVESEYGKGSKFIVSVYLKVQEEKIDDGELAGLPVLVVDDDVVVCDNTCERLEELGMIAEGVGDGRAALAKVVEAHAAFQDYFAVILDYRMPDLNGVETTRLIREKVGNDLPIIMLSAYDLSEQMETAKEAGANGFITKPLFRSRLAYKLKQFINGAAEEERLVAGPLIGGSYEGRRILLVED
ncbi:MAG: ATP-binding protein, partial [Oscillospiraceae bacterium]|nr:ATP-binding protein [Oscillospiraceae bacterium]